MSGEFDPYHRWLGIPPKHQPANHYRLLGLELFEDDPEVIHDAAERQMAHVRTYQLGPQVELSQQILNELASAKACLIDSERKAAYDASLRASLQPSATVAARPPALQASAPPRRIAAPPPPPAPPLSSPPPPPRYAPGPPVSTSAAREAASSPRGMEWLARADAPRTSGRVLRSRSRSLLIGAGAAVGLPIVVGVVVIVGTRWAPPLAQMPAPPSARLEPSTAVAASRQPPRKPAAPQARSPKLAPIENRTVKVGERVELIARLDRGTFAGQLRYDLAADAPNGATIEASSGRFGWTPSLDLSPGTYPVTVEVRHPGSDRPDDRATFTIMVRKPIPLVKILAVASQTVAAGSSHTFTVSIQRPGGFEGDLVFSLRDGPSWLSIDPRTGTVACAPSQGTAEGPYSAKVSVICPKAEVLPDERSFQVIVVGPPKKLLATLLAEKNLTLNDLDVRASADRIADTLWQEYQAPSFNPHVFVSQDPPAIASLKDNKLDGVIVYFAAPPVPPAAYSRNKSSRARIAPVGLDPKQLSGYVIYHRGQRSGVSATWAADSRPEYWCNDSNEQHPRLCCLFRDGSPAAMVEYDHGKVQAVHLVAANRVDRTIVGEEAAGDAAAEQVFQEVHRIETGLKKKVQGIQRSWQRALHAKLARLDETKRANAQRDRQQRNAEQERDLQQLWQRFRGGH